MRIIQILILVIIPYSASQALSICLECVLRNMQPMCNALDESGLLKNDVRHLVIDKHGNVAQPEGKICAAILAEHNIDQRVAQYGGENVPDDTPETFCQFLIESQLVDVQQRENCITFYRKL